jgi:hypothetical protein
LIESSIADLEAKIIDNPANIQYKKDLYDAKQNLLAAEIDRDNLTIKLEQYQADIENYYYEGDTDKLYWNRNVFEHPELLNFWFDFLDTEGELQ